MPNRTEGVKTLVEEVLATLPTPYSEHVIDEAPPGCRRTKSTGSPIIAFCATTSALRS